MEPLVLLVAKSKEQFHQKRDHILSFLVEQVGHFHHESLQNDLHSLLENVCRCLTSIQRRYYDFAPYIHQIAMYSLPSMETAFLP
jgi:hypothetical protein